MITSKKIYLTSIEEKDLEKILIWRNNEKFRLNFREHREISYYQEYKWFKQINSKECNDEYYFAIRLINSHEIIGVVGLNHINWINRNCQLSLYIGKNDLYLDNNGWADEAAVLIQEYAFKTLNLNKIYVEVYAYDVLKVELLKRLGYQKEGLLKKHVYKNGSYHDSYIFSLLKEE